MSGLDRFGALGTAEVKMVEGLDSGALDSVSPAGMPETGDEESRVRAELVRFVLLHGAEELNLHERGLRLGGAWITGVLDLEGCRIPRDIGLLDCRFDATPVLRSAIMDTVSLDGSDLPGLAADRLDARGDLLFRGACLRGPLQLRGARVGGDLIFDGATLDHPGDRALRAERISVRGSALFRGATLRGGIDLTGSRIGGDIDLTGAILEGSDRPALEADSAQVEGDVTLRMMQVSGSVSLVTARIGGDVNLSGATVTRPQETAVDLGRSTVKGAFFLRDGARVTVVLSLNGASFGAIVDDPDCWPRKGDLWLNRCEYGAFLGGALGADARLDWLSRQTPERWGEDFWPQPYEQLAHVFGEMGHDEERRRVLMEKERLLRRARRKRTRNPLLRALLWSKDALIGVTTGYGRVPLLAIIWIVLLWVIGAVYYSWLNQENAMRPNTAMVLRSPEWVLCAVARDDRRVMPSIGTDRAGLAMPGEAQLACYRRQPEAEAYPKFNAIMLSADSMVPGLGNGQNAFWSPDTRLPKGNAGKWFMYAQTILGFGLGLLAVAGFSGIVKSN
jgi:hypothetical protein